MQLSRRSLISAAAVSAAACTSLAAPTARAAPAPRTLTPADPYGPGTDLHVRKYDFRAMWIATVTNIDWPLKRGLSPTLPRLN